MRVQIPLAPLSFLTAKMRNSHMLINRIGKLLGASGVAVGIAELAHRFASHSSPVYAIGNPPITAAQWDQWSPLILSMSSTFVGVFMLIWSRVSSNRDERLKTGFKAELLSISDKLDDLDAKIASAKAQSKDAIAVMQEQVSDIAVKVDQHHKVITAAQQRQRERAKEGKA